MGKSIKSIAAVVNPVAAIGTLLGGGGDILNTVNARKARKDAEDAASLAQKENDDLLKALDEEKKGEEEKGNKARKSANRRITGLSPKQRETILTSPLGILNPGPTGTAKTLIGS